MNRAQATTGDIAIVRDNGMLRTVRVTASGNNALWGRTVQPCGDGTYADLAPTERYFPNHTVLKVTTTAHQPQTTEVA
jgi:hypothetical protein